MLGLKSCCGDFHDEILFLAAIPNRLDQNLLILEQNLLIILAFSQIYILSDKAIDLVIQFITLSHGVGCTVTVMFQIQLIARLRGCL